MPKILSQGGVSLADQYDVQGSIAGIEELESREVTLVHEMGKTLFSERIGSTFRRSTVTFTQSIPFIIPITNFPANVTRILGVQVFASDVDDVDDCQVSVTDPINTGGQDFPIWVFDRPAGTNHHDIDVVMAGVTTHLDILVGEVGIGQQTPTFVFGDSQGTGGNMRNITLRGNANAFGGGSSTVTLLVHLAFVFQLGVNSYGSDVPSW